MSQQTVLGEPVNTLVDSGTLPETASPGRLDSLPRVQLGHLPTPIERLDNLSSQVSGSELYVKRDDCSGLAFGGNKVRQLEFYLGEAAAQGADTVLITGAVQSNYVRTAAAAANKLGMACHIQLEDRVPEVDEIYRNSGNVLLDRLLGATLHYYPEGEDEAGADRRVREIAGELQQAGKSPYVIPLAPGHAPLGALGYVVAAQEILNQATQAAIDFDEVVVASGSGHTHAGLLFGLKALGSNAMVTGICVRRGATAQRPRIMDHCHDIAQLLDIDCPVQDSDIVVDDRFLAPGYGQLNDEMLRAMERAAREEGLILDPTYTAKAFAGFLDRAGSESASNERRLLFVHTGGQPALFSAEPKLTAYLSRES